MERFDKQLIFILLLGLTIRAYAIYFFGDNSLENEWGILVKNLENEKIFGFRSFNGKFTNYLYASSLCLFFIFFKNFFAN